MSQNQQEHTNTYDNNSFDWRGALSAIALLVFLYFTGPVIFLSLVLQRWAAASIWRAPDRWASIRTFAWLLPMLYIPTVLFRVQIAFLWNMHPWLGEFAIWPPTATALVARAMLALPLAPALALALEHYSPRTLLLRSMIRRPRIGEVLRPPKTSEIPLLTEPEKQVGQKPTPAKKQTAKQNDLEVTATTHYHQERDQRLPSIVSAEEAERRRQAKQAEASTQLKKTTPVETELVEAEAEETITPDPFKARNIDWSRVKE